IHTHQDLFIETDRVSHFYKCRILQIHSMTFALARSTENMASHRASMTFWLAFGLSARTVQSEPASRAFV
ncbi:unnamed protein product, partial [Mycena citricolor]